MEILITGAAGFIGFSISHYLLKQGYHVIGIDNLNDYYDVQLKKNRLEILKESNNFIFYNIDITDREKIADLANKYNNLQYVLHLAAQAGVRYSLENPFIYGESNVLGQLTMLELCRSLPNIKHFIYASSSSVYGANTKLPFAVSDRTDNPISLYAATKKSCELITESYSHLYNIPSTGIRYFTVYGPWGRPDMAAFIFTKALLNKKEIPVFNNGQMRRNFTYIDDIVEGTFACINKPSIDKQPPHKIYNIGNNRSEQLMDFIKTLEKITNCQAELKPQPMQPGDVKETIADITASTADLGFIPKTSIKEGLEKFVSWYRSYYKI